MTALYRAFALEEMNDVAMIVREHLEFDMPRPIDEPLHVQRAIAERGRRLASRLLDARRKRPFLANGLHPDAAATGRRLEENGEADVEGGRGDGLVRLVCRRLARYDRHAGFLRNRACGDLRSEPLDHRRRRPDERDAGFCACGRERSAFSDRKP